jgi:hypothetical protein
MTDEEILAKAAKLEAAWSAAYQEQCTARYKERIRRARLKFSDEMTRITGKNYTANELDDIIRAVSEYMDH